VTREQEAARGDRARRILDDELYQETFATVREHLTRKMLATTLANREEREQYFLQLNLLDKLRSVLEYAMQTGKVAVFKLEVEKKRGTR
jgi:hypothetical protein